MHEAHAVVHPYLPSSTPNGPTKSNFEAPVACCVPGARGSLASIIPAQQAFLFLKGIERASAPCVVLTNMLAF
jgi:hypothetical protein